MRDLFLKRLIKKKLKLELFGHRPGKYDITLQAIFTVDCKASPFGSSILTENVEVGDGNLRMFGGLPKPGTARTSRLAECAKAVSKTNLGRRLLMLTCIKPRLLRLQKSTNEIAWGHTGPGLTSISPEEQSRMRVRQKAIKTGCLVCWGQRI